jgi:hypothetical protein
MKRIFLSPRFSLSFRCATSRIQPCNDVSNHTIQLETIGYFLFKVRELWLCFIIMICSSKYLVPSEG